MTTITPRPARHTQRPCDLARQRIIDAEAGPLFLCDWDRTLMIHYRVDAKLLQPQVPFALDLFEGEAYISLVAFTLRRMRTNVAGRVSEWLFSPVSNHGFLNLRTYVGHMDEPGIYFLAEWLPNAVNLFVGPRTFGLPYRRGQVHYDHAHETGSLHGCVTPAQESGQLQYHYDGEPITRFQPCDQDSLEHFLFERYTVFTDQRGTQRRFRVWHEPWRIAPIELNQLDQSVLAAMGPWHISTERVGTYYSPGVFDVWLGRPMCLHGRFTSQLFTPGDATNARGATP